MTPNKVAWITLYNCYSIGHELSLPQLPIIFFLPFQITGLKSFCIGKESGTYSSPSGQKSYLFCFNGITEQRECPKKTLFNPKEKICDLPDNFLKKKSPVWIRDFWMAHISVYYIKITKFVSRFGLRFIRK